MHGLSYTEAGLLSAPLHLWVMARVSSGPHTYTGPAGLQRRTGMCMYEEDSSHVRHRPKQPQFLWAQDVSMQLIGSPARTLTGPFLCSGCCPDASKCYHISGRAGHAKAGRRPTKPPSSCRRLTGFRICGGGSTDPTQPLQSRGRLKSVVHFPDTEERLSVAKGSRKRW